MIETWYVKYRYMVVVRYKELRVICEGIPEDAIGYDV